jgi:hypothetical protein
MYCQFNFRPFYLFYPQVSLLLLYNEQGLKKSGRFLFQDLRLIYE